MTATEFKRRRLLLGLTQRELGARLGLSFQMISRYENGHSPVPRPVEIALITFKPETKS